jgi:hypothetical protein
LLGLPRRRGRKARSGGSGGLLFLADRGGEGVEELLGLYIILVWSSGLVLRVLFVFSLGGWLNGGGCCCCGCATGVCCPSRELLSGGL